ncbi:MAG: hypothetical protein FWG98_04705 [Candidatus Cloacimonetes bacterium]|nr:hypothetical protein [Candidatus Cloacimonadota bacterium]
MNNDTFHAINKEISRLEQLLNVAKPFLESCNYREKDFELLSTASMTIQSFYNGVESISLLLLKLIGDSIQKDIKWHRTLFEAMFGNNSKKISFIRIDLRMSMDSFLGFRHVGRYTYATELKWEKMKMLVVNLEDTWNMVKADFELLLKRFS